MTTARTASTRRARVLRRIAALHLVPPQLLPTPQAPLSQPLSALLLNGTARSKCVLLMFVDKGYLSVNSFFCVKRVFSKLNCNC